MLIASTFIFTIVSISLYTVMRMIHAIQSKRLTPARIAIVNNNQFNKLSKEKACFLVHFSGY